MPNQREMSFRRILDVLTDGARLKPKSKGIQRMMSLESPE